MQSPGDNWLPIESNPEVMNPYAAKIGLNVEEFSFQDLLGFEDWAYEMIPQPVLGVIFNFPIKECQTAHKKAQAEQIATSGQQVSSNLFYMKQYAHNACGTIAMVHIVLNALNQYPQLVKADSELSKFAAKVVGATPQAAGELFKLASPLKTAHVEAVSGGQSAVEEEIDRHFIAFVQVEGNLYELDGGKDFPINHGPSQNILEDSVKVIKQFMERDPDEVSFSTLVLAKTPSDDQ